MNTEAKPSLNFGKQGWTVILMQACMFWVMAGACTHGLNVSLPELSKLYNLDYKELLFYVTPASWAAIPAAPIFSWAIEKKGLKFNIVLSCLACAICFGLLGYANSILSFALLFAGVSFFGTGAAYVGGTGLVANWFVRKQALALGFITFGQTFSSAFFVPVLAASFAMFTVPHGFWIMSVIMVALALVVGLLIANRPEDVGLLPDNEPAPVSAEPAPKASSLTNGQLMKMKDIWLMGVSTGMIYIMLVGVVSQMVPRLLELGFPMEKAIFYMSASALFGTFGAYGWGWLNNKVGIKNSLLIYTVWWMVAIGLNITNNSTVLLLSLAMIGLALPGATNYSTAFVSTKFPRAAYIKALGIVHPVQSVVRCCAFSILAFGLTVFGGYTGAYMLLIAIGAITLVLIWMTDLTPVKEQ
jgi:MFS transporter